MHFCHISYFAVACTSLIYFLLCVEFGIILGADDLELVENTKLLILKLEVFSFTGIFFQFYSFWALELDSMGTILVFKILGM